MDENNFQFREDESLGDGFADVHKACHLWLMKHDEDYRRTHNFFRSTGRWGRKGQFKDKNNEEVTERWVM